MLPTSSPPEFQFLRRQCFSVASWEYSTVKSLKGPSPMHLPVLVSLGPGATPLPPKPDLASQMDEAETLATSRDQSQ
jgi:hypothetical protein